MKIHSITYSKAYLQTIVNGILSTMNIVLNSSFHNTLCKYHSLKLKLQWNVLHMSVLYYQKNISVRGGEEEVGEGEGER